MAEMFSGTPAHLPNAVVELTTTAPLPFTGTTSLPFTGMTTTGLLSGMAASIPPPPPARIVPLHAKAGFLLVGSEVFAYRYQATTEQLVITNRDGGLLFPALSGDAAKEALAEIQKLAR